MRAVNINRLTRYSTYVRECLLVSFAIISVIVATIRHMRPVGQRKVTVVSVQRNITFSMDPWLFVIRAVHSVHTSSNLFSTHLCDRCVLAVFAVSVMELFGMK